MLNRGRYWTVWILAAGWLTLAGCSSPIHSSPWNPQTWFSSKAPSGKRMPGDMIPPAKDVGLAGDDKS
jgi:hypothetical protein